MTAHAPPRPLADAAAATAARTRAASPHRLRTVVVGAIGFLTLVDLFAAQAILPALVAHYGVAPAAMGFAVNASTIGMAAACLLVATVAGGIDRRRAIWINLALLAIPTSLLSAAPDLAAFTALRIAQGVFMASAFTLTMTYLAEHCTMEETADALAAYVTGVVASNLIGRLVAASVADMLGLSASFFAFAALNLAGAALVYASFERSRSGAPRTVRAPFAAWRAHLGNPALAAAFAIGFLILFAFIGTFTYVNFVLAGPAIGIGLMSLGFVYFVFLPAMVTTPLAGRIAIRLGPRRAVRAGAAAALAGLPLLVTDHLDAVLAGMTLVGIGTFFAQAIATGFVGRAATTERAAASGLYLASYYLGGLVGAAALGQVYDRLGWAATVVGIGVALLAVALLAGRLAAPVPVRPPG